MSERPRPGRQSPRPANLAPLAPGAPTGAKPLPVREVLMRFVQPAADRLVRALANTRVAPHELVLVHTLMGLVAAWLLAGAAWPGWLAAALLLQLKSLLDNVDGGLARATGQVTEMGRYLDTLMDLLVNLALFLALAQHGPTWLALAAFAVLTLVLSTEFNAMRRHLEEHPELALPIAAAGQGVASVAPGAPPVVVTMLRSTYGLLLAPQDRALRRLDALSFQRAAGQPWAGAPPALRRRWADRFSVATLVNLGLTTQMLALGICAAIGLPYAYVILVSLQLPYVIFVQTLRAARFRAGAPA